MTSALLQDYGKLHPELLLQVVPFSCAAALLEQVRSAGTFDLYILDVIMPVENGIQTGLRLRELDRAGWIFYLTTSPDYAVDSYRAKAAQYLLKPLDRNLFFAALDETAEFWRQQKQSFATIKTRNGLQRLPVHTVVYGELVGRCVQYHLIDGSVLQGMSLRGSFREAVAPLLEQEPFVLCSASFFINLSYVERIERAGIRLAGGGLIPLSRSLRNQVTDRWLDYHLKGAGRL